MSASRQHWDRFHATRALEQLSWYQPRLASSLDRIRAAGLPANAAIADVGGGASTLVDDLLAAGYESPSVIDLSGVALTRARVRLGEQARRVDWREGDITTTELPGEHFDLWHDRGLFHFLVREKQRRAYVAQLRHALKPGARVVLAVFAEDGPDRCAGLPVRRHGPEELEAEMAPTLERLEVTREIHKSPEGQEQSWLYALFRKPAP